ncbi:hypothetical protein ACLB2K_033881 [Fragaria x ananassa]
MNLMKIFASLLVSLPVLITLSLVLRGDPPADRIKGFADARVLETPSSLVTTSSNIEVFLRPAAPVSNITSSNSAENVLPEIELPTQMPKEDKLYGGLLAPGFDEGACFSRYQSSFYRKISTHKPSSYLLSRLRSYEQLHKRCGPNTKPYSASLKQLKKKSNGQSTSASHECKYVVWIANSGLGNRILSITAAFVYALLTNRVLLLDPGKDLPDLFCEPFPDTSWLLSSHFPIKSHFDKFDQTSPRCYGNMLKKTSNSSELSLPSSYVYLHLGHDYDDQDKLFFCDEEQSHLGKVDWLVMKTDNYFVPSLFLMPSFEQELNKLFPERETVFHHLGRYLFHPSNHVWGLITRYYHAYLAKADERVGIQVRTFEPAGPGPFKHVMDQILACVFTEKLLPRVDEQNEPIVDILSSGTPKMKSVLITSLKPDYSENLRTMYWEHPAVTGDLIGVFQPSHEGEQRTDNKLHDRKALAEMFLLSFSDVLVTSAWSTFGYVAQGLGGLKPWILFKPENQTVPNPPCRRLQSMEPCFHAPPLWDCKEKRGTDTGAILPHVRHCEDISWGLQLIDIHES